MTVFPSSASIRPFPQLSVERVVGPRVHKVADEFLAKVGEFKAQLLQDALGRADKGPGIQTRDETQFASFAPSAGHCLICTKILLSYAHV